jgi:serine phosphatase RsbU (regulator of sigma subunit)
VIAELPLAAGQIVVAFTDGLPHAGARKGLMFDPLAAVSTLGCPPECGAQELADALLGQAVALDDGRPGDDIAVVVAALVDRPDPQGPDVRRMAVSFPVPPV